MFVCLRVQMSAAPNNDKIYAVQAKTQEVAAVARQNIDLAISRGEQLDALDEKAAALEQSAKTFHTNAVKVRRRFCFHYYRLMFIIGLILIMVLIAIIYAVKAAKG